MEKIENFIKNKKQAFKQWANLFIDDMKYLGKRIKIYFIQNSTPVYIIGNNRYIVVNDRRRRIDEHQTRKKQQIENFVSLMLQDTTLMMPVYLPGLQSESDADALGLAPMVFIWNMNQTDSTYSLSINGRCVGHLLEAFVPRSDPFFADIRDDVMQIIRQFSLAYVARMELETGLRPDQIFTHVPPQAETAT